MKRKKGTVSLQTARRTMIGVVLIGMAGIGAAIALPVAPSGIAQNGKPQAGVAGTSRRPPPGLNVARRAAPGTAVAPAAPPAPVSYAITHALTLAGPLKHGDYVWNEAGAPPGPMLITVDLAAQTLSVFRAGHEIGVAVILYGDDDKPTPLGSFAITEKDADHVSNLYEDAPMPYMLRLTSDGISIHGATVDPEWATNGCVGVPVPFARLLFDQVKLGDRVIITRGKTLKVGDQVPVA